MEYMIGCNYWASNAGTEMWRDWDPDAIREDLEILSSHGIRYMRVFPNWRDFQPIMPVYGGCASLVGYKLEQDREPENPYYLDEVMLERFSVFCDLCAQFEIKLIVGLLTGWMSGRLFIPAALFGKNLYTDPVAITFEQRFIEGMVTRFKDKSAIYAWDLGNECNCMCEAPDYFATRAWTGMIANSIRAFDASRPVVSGMHSLGVERCDWRIQDQAECCDILTTHPYPLWVTHAYKDHTASFRTMMHATCETKYYADVGGKPCLAEETGTMGPMICDDETAADFMRLNLFSNWANGSAGVMWWCANEQAHLMTDPYTRNMCETELGMIDGNRQPKPVLKETKRIEKVLSEFNFTLPKAKEDAVCIVTQDQDQWGAAYMTYALAKQAGLNLGFSFCESTLPESEVYLLPSVCGIHVMPKSQYLALQKKVYEGATLYVSVDTGMFSDFKELFGMRVKDSGIFNDTGVVQFQDASIPFKRSVRYELEPAGGTVLATDDLGYAAITKHQYGKGVVYFVNFPLETMLLEENNAFDKDFYKVYKKLFENVLQQHEVTTENPYIGLTLHPDKAGALYCVAVNYSPKQQDLALELQNGYQISDVYYGDTEQLAPFEAAVFKIEK